MNDYIYSIYDKLSGRYCPPFAASNDLVAARIAVMAYSYNKSFDTLYRIGIFANSSAAIEACEPVDISDSVEQVLKLAQEKEVAENG